jgi:hypothetical protein
MLFNVCDCYFLQPPIQGVSGPVSLGAKWPGREADHSPPPSFEVKNRGAIPPLPIHLYGVVLNICVRAIRFLLLIK